MFGIFLQWKIQNKVPSLCKKIYFLSYWALIYVIIYSACDCSFALVKVSITMLEVEAANYYRINEEVEKQTDFLHCW
jgi:hypothetical protein